MSWKFNPPPGWPQQPEGWVPPPGWTPDPSWPPAPAGWQFWVPADAPTAAGAPAPAATAPAPAAEPQPAQPQFGQPPAGAHPQPGPQQPGPPQPGPPRSGSGRPWFARWWAILVLVLVLLLGIGGGFGVVRLVQAASDTVEQAADGLPDSMEPTPSVDPPADLSGDVPGAAGDLVDPSDLEGNACADANTIMLELSLGPMGEDGADPQARLVDARRDAARALRALDADNASQREALDQLADVLDDAAQQVEDNPGDDQAIEESLESESEAFLEFTVDGC